MTIETALDALKPYHPQIPTGELEFIRNNWNEAEPHLLAELDRGIANPLKAEQSAFFLYALFLCAELRCEAAFDRYLRILRILRLPNLLLDNLIGDILTENMQTMLARTCGARIEPLKALVEDENINEFARSAALRSLLNLVAIGSLAREKMAEYCIDLLAQRLERHPSYAWDATVTMAEQLHLTESLPLIETAFTQGWANPGTQSFEKIKNALSLPRDEETVSAWREKNITFDTVREMGFSSATGRRMRICPKLTRLSC